MEQEKITDIRQLKKGDKIWTINNITGKVEVLEFVCIHPHCKEYSIFLNEYQDGAPKFYNKQLAGGDYERYEDTNECWAKRIYIKRLEWHKRKIENLHNRMLEIVKQFK